MSETYQVIADSVVMTATPDPAAEASTELLFGEQVEILEADEDWAKCINKTDGYEGFVLSGALDDEPSEATHKIAALRTFAFSEPDFKSPPVRALSFFSPLSVLMNDQGFSLLEQGGWVYSDHMSEISDIGVDPVDAALMFLNAPYLWGGRTSLGLDCSALVQLVLLNAGHDCPRDTKDQVSRVGTASEFGDTIGYASIQRGDLVFFDGHVGIMVNEREILNATARHMKVVVEPLDDVAEAYGGTLSVRRI